MLASSIIEAMANAEETLARLAEIPNLTVSTLHAAFALHPLRASAARPISMPRRRTWTHSCGAGSGADERTRFHGDGRRHKSHCLRCGLSRHHAALRRARHLGRRRARYVDAGAELQELVDFTTARGLEGLETLAGHSRDRWARRSTATPAPTATRSPSASAWFVSSMARGCASWTTPAASSVTARAFSSAGSTGRGAADGSSQAQRPGALQNNGCTHRVSLEI